MATDQVLIMRTDLSAIIFLRSKVAFLPREMKHLIGAIAEEPHTVLQLTRCAYSPQDF